MLVVDDDKRTITCYKISHAVRKEGRKEGIVIKDLILPRLLYNIHALIADQC